MNSQDTLNEKQKEAMLCTEGPELILAGAGSGKTRVLTHRIAWLIDQKKVDPWHILAITFTNKAAAEMRERVDKLVGEGASEVWVATFHSTCVRILRRFIDRIGYDNHFTIYDADDQKTLMKKVFKELELDTRAFKERTVLSHISSAKDKLMGPEEYRKQAVGYAEEREAECYKRYQAELHQNNALDFDDLINRTVLLFRSCPDVLSYYQERFRYIMVDEYQDTNYAQFKLVELLAERYRNLCVVGDDDQSIYKFRGADIGNILNFEQSFPGARVVKLEQNYRSTANILNAANEVIRHNRGRKVKRLWTSNGEGGKVEIYRYGTATEEADAVISDIQARAAAGDYSHFAVLYRTNAQSRLLEEKCVAKGVPYQLVGGVNFYQRKEIKDVLAYLKTIANGRDDLAAMRIINVPKRGIGQATIDKISVFASANGLSFYEALTDQNTAMVLGKAGEKIKKFTALIESFRQDAEKSSLGDLIEAVIDRSGYKEALKEEGDIEAEARMENIDELISKAVSYEQDHSDLSDEDRDSFMKEVQARSMLDCFLEEVALVADIDRMDEGTEKITLMTLHAAKGLEFSNVYMTGMEDGLFPSNMSIAAPDGAELEEERRLCYVGITRAKEHLRLTSAQSRMVNGETRWTEESRFLGEIPEELAERHENEEDGPFRSNSFGEGSFGGKRGSGGRQRNDWDEPFENRGSSCGRENSDRGNFSGSSYGSGFGHPFGGTAESYGPYGGGFGKKKAEHRRESPLKPASFGKTFRVEKPDHLDYAEGDRVRHFKFGDGKVLAIVNGQKDFEVTVDFDTHGVKKMFAGFAKLQKL